MERSPKTSGSPSARRGRAYRSSGQLDGLWIAVDPRAVLQRAVRECAHKPGITINAACHTFRTHLLDDGYDVRTVEELPGHKDVKTTMVRTHMLNRGATGGRSPMDLPWGA